MDPSTHFLTSVFCARLNGKEEEIIVRTMICQSLRHREFCPHIQVLFLLLIEKKTLTVKTRDGQGTRELDDGQVCVLQAFFCLVLEYKRL